MTKINTIPKPLIRKMFFMLLIGIIYFSIGLAYYIFAKDKMFLALSVVILVISLYRAYIIYKIALKKQYEIVEGIVTKITPKLFYKQHIIYVKNNVGIESSLYLDKKNRIRIGNSYKFYFRMSDKQYTTGSDILDSALAYNQFLGFEELEISLDKSNLNNK